MSSRKQPLSSKQQLINPEATFKHVERMQNLLEEYDRQNQYLNKQVLQLLDRKHALQTKYSIATYKDNGRPKNIDKLADKTGRSLNSVKAKDTQQSRTRKKKYEYIDDEDRDPVSPPQQENVICTSQQRNGQKSRYKYEYTPVQNLNTNSQPRYQFNQRNARNIASAKPFVTTSEWTQTKNSRASQGEGQREAASRFVSQEQLKRKNLISNNQDVQQLKLNRQQSVNLVPILKRQAYISSSHNNSISLSSSPEGRANQSPDKQVNLNDSKLSRGSSKSRKSGIYVVSSAKNLEQQEKMRNSKIQYSKKEQNKIDDNRSQIITNKSAKRVSFSDQKLTQKLSQSIIKPEQIIKQYSIQNQPKLQQKKLIEQIKEQQKKRFNPIQIKPNQQFIQTATFKPILLNQTVKKQQQHRPSTFIPRSNQLRQSSIYRQMGVNTSPKQSSVLVRHRSISQHRIQPSQKILYHDEVPLRRKDSQPQLRENSREMRQGKKKFLNLVSTSMLAKKLNQNQRLNDVYK